MGVKSAMPVRQATEMDLAARPVEREPALGTGQIRGAGRQAAHQQDQPHAATCSEPALPSVWVLALSAAAPKAEGKEESRERKPN